MDAHFYSKGTPIFAPGDDTRFLYLVASGSVVERSRRDDEGLNGPVWLELAHKTGSYFGQHALFSERYDSEAMAAEDTMILEMAAADLRTAMERNQDLYEEMLREKLAGRLRRIPLLRGLQDWQIRRLAQVVGDKKVLEKGDPLPLEAEPGVWMVDWGQITVTGQANRAATSGAPWRLTSGNFIVAGGRNAASASSALRTGAAHSATSAEAHLKSHVLPPATRRRRPAG